MLTLIRKLFWVALFLVFTIGFVTLFNHGFATTRQFTADAKGEYNELVHLLRPIKRDKDHSDKIDETEK